MPAAVGLAVVQDVDALDALLLQERRVGGALEVVRHRDTRVVALARREVLVRLTRHAARLREADVRVGRADHRDAAARSAVDDRGDDLGTARVERADDAQEVLDRLVAVGVVRARLRIPRALGGRGVVARGIRDRLVADLEVHLLQLEADGLRRSAAASGRSEPCRGRSLAMMYLPLPNVWQVFGRPASAVRRGRARHAARRRDRGDQRDERERNRESPQLHAVRASLVGGPASRHRVTRGLYQAGRARATTRVCATHTRRHSDVWGGLRLGRRCSWLTAGAPPVRAGPPPSEVRGAPAPLPTLCWG